MTESIGPISSAVILPEPSIQQSPPPKRRQSSASSPASKRPRISHDGSNSPTSTRASPPAADLAVKPSDEKAQEPALTERRKSSVQEERKRGQRLFGGLLSTLSQSTPNGQQKRRLEIEKRQAEKARAQKEDDEARRAERLAKLKAARKVEQAKFDEQSMRIQHSNMLAMANFLYTKTQPKLYYKPWDLLPEQSDHIKNQIAEAQAIVDRELEDFNSQHPKEAAKATKEEETKFGTNNTSQSTVGEPRNDTESPALSPPKTNDTTNAPVQAPQLKAEEQTGEVVETEEDIVLY